MIASVSCLWLDLLRRPPCIRQDGPPCCAGRAQSLPVQARRADASSRVADPAQPNRRATDRSVDSGLPARDQAFRSTHWSYLLSYLCLYFCWTNASPSGKPKFPTLSCVAPGRLRGLEGRMLAQVPQRLSGQGIESFLAVREVPDKLLTHTAGPIAFNVIGDAGDGFCWARKKLPMSFAISTRCCAPLMGTDHRPAADRPRPLCGRDTRAFNPTKTANMLLGSVVAAAQ